MNKCVILIAVVALACGWAEGLGRKMCKLPFGKMNFDHEKFSGEWFVVAKVLSPAVPRMPSTCNKIEYSTKEDGNTTHVNVRLSAKLEDGKPMVVIAKGEPVYKHTGSVSQAVWKKEGEDKWMAVFTQSVLATDYTEFAVFYVCHPVFDEKNDVFDKFEIVEILSRKPEMEGTLLGVLKNVLSGFDFDVSEIKMVDNASC